MRHLILIVALGVLLLPSLPATADVPPDADLFWMWNWTQQYDPANPIQFSLVRDVYGLPPGTVPEWDLQNCRLRIPNRLDPRLVKEVWWEVKWGTTIPTWEPLQMVWLEPPAGNYRVTSSTFWKSSAQGGERIWTWKWTIFPQPDVEWICFNPRVFRQFSNPAGTSLFQVEVGSRRGIPEGTTAMLGILGLSTVAAFRRLRLK
ncbi:hypothetical protein [Thermogutta sp.]|uniref:hypothetical protein n=1 Tax=Thermogutta sp. TaxID=1962930 RepID=UPI00321F805D